MPENTERGKPAIVMKDSRVRSIIKSISYRITGTIITSALVFVFTGRWGLSLTVGAVELVVKLLFFYIHERVWLMIRWGGASSR